MSTTVMEVSSAVMEEHGMTLVDGSALFTAVSTLAVLVESQFDHVFDCHLMDKTDESEGNGSNCKRRDPLVSSLNLQLFIPLRTHTTLVEWPIENKYFTQEPTKYCGNCRLEIEVSRLKEKL